MEDWILPNIEQSSNSLANKESDGKSDLLKDINIGIDNFKTFFKEVDLKLF